MGYFCHFKIGSSLKFLSGEIPVNINLQNHKQNVFLR